MKILKESYTKDEIEQRVLDARNALHNLIDEFYILASCLKDSVENNSKYDSLASYTNSYITEIKDISSNFEEDFEDLINGTEDDIDAIKEQADKEDIIDWLSNHDQAWEDACEYFESEDLEEVDLDDLLDWIDEHDQLHDDLVDYLGSYFKDYN